jgi:hypothetical protein
MGEQLIAAAILPLLLLLLLLCTAFPSRRMMLGLGWICLSSFPATANGHHPIAGRNLGTTKCAMSRQAEQANICSMI